MFSEGFDSKKHDSLLWIDTESGMITPGMPNAMPNPLDKSFAVFCLLANDLSDSREIFTASYCRVNSPLGEQSKFRVTESGVLVQDRIVGGELKRFCSSLIKIRSTYSLIFVLFLAVKTMCYSYYILRFLILKQ